MESIIINFLKQSGLLEEAQKRQLCNSTTLTDKGAECLLAAQNPNINVKDAIGNMYRDFLASFKTKNQELFGTPQQRSFVNGMNRIVKVVVVPSSMNQTLKVSMLKAMTRHNLTIEQLRKVMDYFYFDPENGYPCMVLSNFLNSEERIDAVIYN